MSSDNKINLYDLPKDMLIKLITTIQDEVEKKYKYIEDYEELSLCMGYNLRSILRDEFEDLVNDAKNDGKWYKCDECGIVDLNSVESYNCPIYDNSDREYYPCEGIHYYFFHCKNCKKKYTCSECGTICCSFRFHNYNCRYEGCDRHLGDKTKCINCK